MSFATSLRGPLRRYVGEEGRDVALALPAGFTVDDRREYGAAAVHFLSLA